MATVTMRDWKQETYYELVPATCWCGITFGVPETLWREGRKTVGLYCPLGHHAVWSKSAADIEREKRLAAEARFAHEQDRHSVTLRRLAAAKGQTTKIKNRVKNGVCPFCNRSFANLKAHMHSKHEDVDVTSVTR